MTELSSPDRPDSPNGEPGSLRELILVALPLVISAGSHSLMNVADRVMLAGYSPSTGNASNALDVIAAVTPAGMLFWTVACLPLGTILYANTFISQFHGADKPRELATSMWQAVWLAIISGILMAGFVPFSGLIFEAAGHTSEVVKHETIYFNVLCGGGIFLLISNAVGCYFSGRQKTLTVMWVNLASVSINAVLDYGLIFGHFGLPELGIQGAAIATVLARVVEIAVYSALILLDRHPYPLAKTWRPNRELLYKFLRFGVPSGVHFFVDNSGFLAFLFVVGSLNRDSMAATNLAFSVNSLIFVPLLGFGTAIQTLVGHHLGAKLPAAATRTTWNAVRLAVLWTGIAAVLLIFFPKSSLEPFLMFEDPTADSANSVRAILPMAARLLKFVAIYSVFDATAVVFASALRGAGDTLFPMIITTFSSWVVMTIPAWLIVKMSSATIDHLWMTCTAHIILMGTAMLLRFLSGKWKQIQLVE